ncbi:calcium homeostasis modulator protein 6 isoform X2 [Poeciliopsis prolifica]|uniref:calcium homeostasis modulator protein 6 isoform X2 n=1 Tax=Poeciliopsis prolifica TaxID=188132 RepID=UPI0024146856|nr:calcium homeostasis modulator protein 6 isoform X2 [Poeciliopsis prolifica]
MDRFKTILNIASKQTNLGFGLVALLTAGGEQIFSSVAFKCPCNELNFLYGLVFLLVPALALLLLGYILSKKMWILFTGLWHNKAKLCCWKNLAATCTAFFQISSTALVAPSSWFAVALLNGNYYECAMTGTNVSVYNKYLCKDMNSELDCAKKLPLLPCDKRNEEVLRALRSQSQILGWLVITFIMLSSLLIICLARCNSPISYQQLKFWRAYAQEERNQLLVSSSPPALSLLLKTRNDFPVFHPVITVPVHILPLLPDLLVCSCKCFPCSCVFGSHCMCQLFSVILE